MKIKIIELLTKIANGEEIPKKIKFKNIIWEYCKNGSTKDYINDYNGCLMEFIPINKVGLNDSVEIIEEPKKIEKILISMDDNNMSFVGNSQYKHLSYSEIDLMMATKINELIDEINNLKEK